MERICLASVGLALATVVVFASSLGWPDRVRKRRGRPVVGPALVLGLISFLMVLAVSLTFWLCRRGPGLGG